MIIKYCLNFFFRFPSFNYLSIFTRDSSKYSVYNLFFEIKFITIYPCLIFVVFAIGIDNLLTCTKTATPYGMKLGWKLPGPSEMTFTIHLKDPKKARSGSIYLISDAKLWRELCGIGQIGSYSFTIALSMTLLHY